MDNQHTIIYVMRHIDIGGHIEIPYKKVGITGAGSATLTSRLQQISNTKSPIKAQCISAWEHNDARAVENAMHLLLEDNRIEGEWFLDKDDSLVERIQPMMELLGAKEITIEEVEDSYTRNIIKKENDSKSEDAKSLLGEISSRLKYPLRNSIRIQGPTLFSDKTNLTYYVNMRKSGKHNVGIGRSEKVYRELSSFLEENGFEFEQHPKKGHARMLGITTEVIIDAINKIESDFK
jgi:Meiotically up-regulated gene 113